jgi:hypothetical protein
LESTGRRFGADWNATAILVEGRKAMCLENQFDGIGRVRAEGHVLAKNRVRIGFQQRQAAGAEHCRQQPALIFVTRLKIEPHIAEQAAGNVRKIPSPCNFNG